MKHKGIIALIFTVALMLTSCMRNGDDIGYFYGQWIIEELRVDGSVQFDGKVTDQGGEVYSWRFQNDILQLTSSNQLHEFQLWTGQWTCDDISSVCELRLFFPYYEAMPEIFLLSERMAVMSYRDDDDGKIMTWKYAGPEGQECVMKMRKSK